MKKFRPILICAGIACAAVLCLLAPDATLWGMDRYLSTQRWTDAGVENSFVYEGTLENRIRALDAWQNGSTGVQCAASEADGPAPADIWKDLYDAGLLPVCRSPSECVVRSFALRPDGISAEYRYLDIVATAGSERLHGIVDVQTGQYLRIDFTCDPEILESWMAPSGEGFAMNSPSGSRMDDYAALLGLGPLRDLGGSYTGGDMVQSYESDIQGTLFALSFQYAAQPGLIAYKLFVRPYA